MRLMAFLLLPLFVGCATMGELVQKPGQPTAKTVSATSETVDQVQLQPYDGPRARVAVYRFTDRTAKGKGGVQGFYWYSAEIGDGMADMLNDALLQSSRFIVLDRQALQDVLQEQDLATGGRVSRATAAPVGQIEGADLLIKGAITEFEPGAAGARAGLGVGAWGGGLLGWGTALASGVLGGLQQSHIAMIIQVVDARSSRLLFSTTVEGKANDFNIGGFLAGFAGGVAGAGGLGVWQKTPVEKAIRIAIIHAIQELSAKTPPTYFRHRDGAPGAPGPVTAITAARSEATTQASAVEVAPSPSPPGALASPSPTSGTSAPPVTSPSALPAPHAGTKPDVAGLPPLPSVVYVRAGLANVRDAAGPEGKIVVVVREGAKLAVLGESPGWYLIQTDDRKEGWISKSLTRP